MGEFFEEQTAEAIVGCVEKFTALRYDSAVIRGRVERFDKERFKATIKDLIERELAKHLARQHP